MSDLTPDKAYREVNRSIMKYVMDQVSIVNEIYDDEASKPRMVKEKAPENAFPIGQLMSA